jgi:DHA2 family methylenomycin A resistance protein-like MFS transporter
MAGGAVALEGIGAHSAFAALVPQLIALGFGLGLIVPAMTASLLGSVHRSRSGIASGTLNTARQTGSVIGVALFGSLIAGGGRVVGGLHIALIIAAVLSLVVAGLSVRTPSAQT